MLKMWKKVERKKEKKVMEYFRIGEFITSDTWESSCPPSDIKSNYPYLKDCFEINWNLYGRDIVNEINMTEIIHVTSCENALSILSDGGFRPGTKNIPDIGEIDLVWFGLNVGEAEIDMVRQNYKSCAYYSLQHGLPDSVAADVADRVASEFANTAPFQPMSRYGNVKFKFSIKEVLDKYQDQFCKNQSEMTSSEEMFSNLGTNEAHTFMPEMRKLGTFAYKQETMHVILVCPPGTQFIYHCPELIDHEDDDPIIKTDLFNNSLTWMPHSTGENVVSVTPEGNIKSKFKRWEHVAFAFVVPKEHCLKIDKLSDHVSLCLHLTQEFKGFKVVSIHNAIIDMLLLIRREENYDIIVDRANLLIRMICGYNYEMPLYAKTVKSDLIFGDLTVDKKWVHLNFKRMLPTEFERLHLFL